MTDIQLKTIPIELLFTSANIREEYGDLAALAGTFHTGGPDEPPVVYPNSHGYVVIHGNRRVRAALQQGLTELACIVRPAPTDFADLCLRQLIADLQHEALSGLEKARAMRKLLEADPAMTQAKLAKMLGKSTAEISQTLSLLDLAESVQNALRVGDISEGIAELLLPLAAEEQERVLPLILAAKGKRSGRPTVAQTRRIIQGDLVRDEDMALARILRQIKDDRQEEGDVCDKLLDGGEPTNAVHLYYWLLQADYNTTQAHEVHRPDGCSLDLRAKIHDLAAHLEQVAGKIKEETK